MDIINNETVSFITTREAVENKISLLPEEAEYFDAFDSGCELPLRINPYYFSLIKDDPSDPVRRQCIPRREELYTAEYELGDPLGEQKYSPVQRLVHRYPDRALLLVTDCCAMYCRHCFRRHFTSKDTGAITDCELEPVLGYLKNHSEINELLLSGGDPLTMGDRRLSLLLSAVRDVRPDIALRMCTRIPVVNPGRITDDLAGILSKAAPLWVVTQYNHPAELTPESIRGINTLVSGGIPVLNQTVLLRGVNDSADVLADLFQGLVRNRVKPYYLFQGDLAGGTSHLRVPLEKGFSIMKELRKRISGLALPVYAVDLPGGGGKIPLTESYLKQTGPDWFVFESTDGEIYRYPREK